MLFLQLLEISSWIARKLRPYCWPYLLFSPSLLCSGDKKMGAANDYHTFNLQLAKEGSWLIASYNVHQPVLRLGDTFCFTGRVICSANVPTSPVQSTKIALFGPILFNFTWNFFCSLHSLISDMLMGKCINGNWYQEIVKRTVFVVLLYCASRQLKQLSIYMLSVYLSVFIWCHKPQLVTLQV